jgi:hypothetical protein
MKRASKRTRKDAQAVEFEKRDVGHDIVLGRSAVVVRPRTR